MSFAETAAGKVRGESRADGVAFKGIPYGADTAGLGRFRPPRAPMPWSGVLDTTRFYHRAPQVDRPYPAGFDWLFSTPTYSEDCLVLNVFTPAVDTSKRPVMVWLHGGAFAFGSSDVPVLDGQNLSTFGDVVVVTLNHRLNVFGYLSLETQDARFADSGNVGMLDLVLALQWVQKNISAFGGDPGLVTLFGQSGGGAKVAMLMAMDCASGLFHRAIVQSPSSGFRVQSREDAAPFTLALFRRLGVTAGNIEALQKVSTEQLVHVGAQVVADFGGEDRFRPMIDGRTLQAQPFFPSAPAASAHVPMMIGYAATEATFYLASDLSNREISLDQVRDRLMRFMKIDAAQADKLLAAYAANHPLEKPIDLLVHAASDHMYRLTTIEGAVQKAKQGAADVYLYEFGWNSPAFDGFIRAPHTAEIPFVFGHVDMARAFTGDSASVTMQMHEVMGAWTRFARHGNPNGSGLPPWDPFTETERATLVFHAPSTHLEHDPGGEDRQVMARFPRFLPGSALNFRTA